MAASLPSSSSPPPYLHPVAAASSPPCLVPLVDLREPSTAIHRRHVLGSLHIPASAYADRSLELPARNNRYALLVDRGTSASRALASRMCASFGADIAAVYELGGDDDDEDDASSAAFWGSVPPERVVRGCAYPASLQPRLWRPSPLLEVFLERHPGWIPPPAASGADADADTGGGGGGLRVLDAGSGTCRNAVYLLRAWPHPTNRVVAVDNRKAMVEKGLKFASREGMAERCAVVLADMDEWVAARGVRRGAAGEEGEGGGPFDVLLFMRFPHKTAIARSLELFGFVPHQERGTALAPSRHTPGWRGFVVIEAFHTSTSHPTDRSSQFAEGEALELVLGGWEAARKGGGGGVGEEEGAAHPQGQGPLPVVDVVMEELGAAEDGRPLMNVVLRVRAEG
jgi:SAM-dependent methyltransferase